MNIELAKKAFEAMLAGDLSIYYTDEIFDEDSGEEDDDNAGELSSKTVGGNPDGDRHEHKNVDGVIAPSARTAEQIQDEIQIKKFAKGYKSSIGFLTDYKYFLTHFNPRKTTRDEMN